MRILWTGFVAKNHSWSIVAQNICRQLLKLGHDVDIFSTNGTDKIPKDINLIGYSIEGQPGIYGSEPQGVYDCQLSYTKPTNFKHYFNNGESNRFGIWNYETTILPVGFSKHHMYLDKLLPSSNFSKGIFINNKIPEDKQVVISHGIDLDKFKCDKFKLKTDKKIKILVNIAQPHHRKNIPGILKSYGEAFKKYDDVCLVLKVSKVKPNNIFEVDFDKLYASWERDYKNHAEVEIIDYFIDDIEPLYNACDIVFTMSHAECFWMPGLEGLAANKIVISPRYGGQLDYLNDNNSILIDGKIIRASAGMQYWQESPFAQVFEPDIEQAAKTLKNVAMNYNDYFNKLIPNINIENYTWESVSKKIIDLCK